MTKGEGFTDEDLKRLKEHLEITGRKGSDEWLLIRRLEAAEAYLHHKDSFEYAEAWRKSCGKEG